MRRTVIKWVKQGEVKRKILNQTKKEGNIVYGARSIQAQTGIFSRGTEDYDIFSKKPEKSAMATEKELDKVTLGDNYYVKSALHPGTWKVMDKGFDNKKGTKDDFGIVDYTKFPKPKPKTVTIRGVKYRKLSEEEKAKRKSIKDPAYKFRHKKDKEDLNRMKLAKGK